jgi:hypothetical protein
MRERRNAGNRGHTTLSWATCRIQTLRLSNPKEYLCGSHIQRPFLDYDCAISGCRREERKESGGKYQLQDINSKQTRPIA